MLKRLFLVCLFTFAIATVMPTCAQKKAAKGGAPMAAKGGNQNAAPTTLLHVITLRWKADATEAQKQAALDGAKNMVGKVPGLLRVWVKSVNVQGGTQEKPFNGIIAMEFTDAAALKAYASHPAHDEWYKIYIPLREESRTSDVSN